MGGKRQKNQLKLAFDEKGRSEAPRTSREGTETPTAKRISKSPAGNDGQRMEEVCERNNCLQALKRVKSNKGSAGIDGMTVGQLPGYLKEHWPAIREQLLAGTYKPQPVRRVEIPKPDGGVRQLGIPTVSTNCTGPQYGFGMGGDPTSVSSASRPALRSTEEAPHSGRRYVDSP